MPNVIPPEVPGPVAGQPGHFPHHDWLTASVLALDAQSGVWQPYTPTLTASATNPTLGIGSAQIGRFIRRGELVICRASIRFGASGTNAGSGTYSVGLPTKAAANFGSSYVPYGVANIRSGAGQIGGPYWLSVNANGDAVGTIRYPGAWPVGGNGIVGAAAPWAFGASDRIEYWAVYEYLP